MDAPRQIARVVFTGRLQLPGHGRQVSVVPHRVGPADRQARPIARDPHGLAEGAEVGVEDALVVADEEDLTGLVGRDHHAHLQLPEERGQVRGIDAAQGGVGCCRGRSAGHRRGRLSRSSSQSYPGSAIRETDPLGIGERAGGRAIPLPPFVPDRDPCVGYDVGPGSVSDPRDPPECLTGAQPPSAPYRQLELRFRGRAGLHTSNAGIPVAKLHSTSYPWRGCALWSAGLLFFLWRVSCCPCPG